jgi:hypothetical protein
MVAGTRDAKPVVTAAETRQHSRRCRTARRRPDRAAASSRSAPEPERPASGAAADASEADRLRLLGEDPAIGGFRKSEMETALRVESELGVTLTRSTNPAVDWVDANGKTYDSVGNFDGRYFDREWPHLQERILDHPAKADRVPIDVSRFTPAQVHLIQQFILDLGPRVFLVGM